MGKGRVLRIYETRTVFENLDSSTAPVLLVSQTKDTGNREFEKFSKDQLPELGNSLQVIPFETIYGFYDLLSGSYVALVVDSEPHINLPFQNMRKAKKIIVIPLFRNGRLLSDVKQKDEDRYLQLLHQGFSEHHFYFSFTHDITLTQQRQAKLTSKQLNDPMWSRADLRFFWNRELVEDLVIIHADEWIVPFMSAYVETRECTLEELHFTLLFISRRSRYRQGCRFTKRGIDDFGNVANFVETEQIAVSPDGKLTSYVQVRGSIPVKWTSPVHMKYEPIVYIDEDRSKSVDYATRHVQELVEKYSDNSGAATILLVNLVDKKKDQARLGEAYKATIDEVKTQFPNHHIIYEWFDFHHECKQKGKWNNLAKLIMSSKAAFSEIKYFSKLPNGQVQSWQKGVIRTNCMDNLDRTNVVQTLFARRSLLYQLGKNQAVEIDGKHIMQTDFKAFESIFRTIWTNHANSISQSYAGTGALKTDFTKTGKNTLKGKFNDGVNSLMRYYINNFLDGTKQDAIDLMLGRYRPDPASPSPFSGKASKDYASNTLTKAFVLLMLIFMSLLLFIPPMATVPISSNNNANKLSKAAKVSRGSEQSPATCSAGGTCDSGLLDGDVFEQNIKHLQMHFFLSLLITLAVLLYVTYKVVKKGSKIGDYVVTRPELCPEPLPAARV